MNNASFLGECFQPYSEFVSDSTNMSGFVAWESGWLHTAGNLDMLTRPAIGVSWL